LGYGFRQSPLRASRESHDRVHGETLIESYRAVVVSLQVPFKVTAVFVNRVVGAGVTPVRIGYRYSQIAHSQLSEIMVGPCRSPELRILMDGVYTLVPFG
jgi:hypothetical protein